MKYVQHLLVSNPVTGTVDAMDVFVLPCGKLVGLDHKACMEAGNLYSPYEIAVEIEEKMIVEIEEIEE